jgi:hypothetical protein
MGQSVTGAARLPGGVAGGAAILRARAAAVSRGALASDRLATVGLIAWCALLAALTWGTWGDLSVDTGYDVLAGVRVAHGELPYIDFTYYYGPLAPLVLGGAGAILGDGVGTSIAVGLALSVLIVLLTHRVARLVVGPGGALLAAALTGTAAFATGNMSFVVPYTASATLAIAASLTALLAVAAHARGGRRAQLYAAGVALGLVTLTRPEFVAALAAGLAVWLVLGPGSWRDAVRDALALAVPAIAVAAVVYGAFLTQVSLSTLITDNLVPVNQLREAGSEVVRSAMPLTAASAVTLAGRLALYALGVAAVLATAALIRRGGLARRAAIGAALLALAGFLAALVVNPEAVRHQLQQAWGWIPAGAGIAAAAVLWAGLRRGLERTVEWRLIAALTALLTVLAATTYDQFFPFATHFANKAAFAMPFAAIFLAWLHLTWLPRRGGAPAAAIGAAWLAALVLAGGVLVIHDAAAESATVHGSGGTLAVAPDQARAFQGAIDRIEATTRPGEPVLIGPQMTWMYVVAGRPDPLPQLVTLPGALTIADQRAAEARMRDVNVAVIDTRSFDEFGHGAFGQTFDRELARWLSTNFRRESTWPVSSDRAIELWRRNGKGAQG